MTHSIALIKKRIIISMRDSKGLLMEIFLPILVVLLGLVLLTQFVVLESQGKEEMKIGLYDLK